MPRKKKELVCKRNELIEARYRLDLNEQRFVLKTISMIKPNDKAFSEYSISALEFAQLLGLEDPKTAYRDLKGIAKSILKKPLTIIREDNSFLVCNWFSSIEYKDGMVIVSHDPKFTPYLLDIQKKFTAYSLESVLKLRSSYSIRLYELLRQYSSKGERFLSLDDLKIMLGIEPKQYPRFYDFRRKVLEKAEKELPLQTDISFTWEPKKTGRRIAGILFHISSTRAPAGTSSNQKDAAAIPRALLDLIPAEYRDNKQVINAIGRNMRKRKQAVMISMIQYAVHQFEKGNNQEPFPRFLGIYLDKGYGEDYDPRQQELWPDLNAGEYIYINGRSIQFLGKWPIVTNDREYSKRDITEGLRNGTIKKA